MINYLLQHLRLVDFLSVIFMAILLLAFTPLIYSTTIKKLKITSLTLKFAVAFIWCVTIVGILFLLYMPVPK
jgi:hypothetical protein